MEFSLQLLLAGGSQVRTATCPRSKLVSSGPSPRAGFPGQISLNCPFTTTKPPRDPVPQPANEPLFGLPAGWPTVPPAGWRTRQPAEWRTRQPMTPPAGWPTTRPTTRSTTRPTTRSTTRPTTRSTTRPTTRSTTRPTTSPTVQPTRRPTVQPNQNCAVSTVERVPCGGSWTSMQSCQAIGCCWDFEFSSCFYPMDECTQDYYFVFSIYHNSASIPLDPASLVIPGTNCRPVILTDTVAVFKFKMDQCGTRSFTVGGTRVYFAEVQTVVEVLNLKYGVISRSSQLRFLIECRYSSSEKTSLASTGYMVKTPSSTVPSVLFSDGLYGVELKLATDETYTTFHPTYHQPLRLLLGKQVYLQLHLVSPTPEAVIIVNYCIAYPRSASNALVLVHEGCANPLDPHTSVLINRDFGEPRRERRFKVTAFQFMEQNTNRYLDEEIYFMCSTEVCFELEGPCEESCFDGVVGFNRINEK